MSSIRIIVVVLTGTFILNVIPAFATSGEPRFIDVLGFSEGEGNVYYRVQSDHVEEPSIFSLKISGVSSPKRIKLESLAGDSLADKLARLRKRLVPLRTVAISKRTRRAEKLGDALPPGTHYLKMKRRVTKRWHDEEFFTPCRTVSLTLWRARSLRSRSITVTECGDRSRVTAVYAIAGHQALFALVSSKPFAWEGGYEVQSPVVLNKRSKRTD